VTHRHAPAGPGEHLHVVATVADREHVRRLEAELVDDVRQTGGLRDPDRREVEPGGPADDVRRALQAELAPERLEEVAETVRVCERVLRRRAVYG
jgi:hypothetical protein